MALKTIRVIARRTVYYYVDIIEHNKTDAIQEAWSMTEDKFTKKEGHDEWRIIGAAIMEKGEPVDDMKCLSPKTISGSSFRYRDDGGTDGG